MAFVSAYSIVKEHSEYVCYSLTCISTLLLRVAKLKIKRKSSFAKAKAGGAERARTADPLLAKQVLSQLSYSPLLASDLRHHTQRLEPKIPTSFLTQMVGLGRVELPTSRLSGVRSNHLSYRPSLTQHETRP